MAEFHREFMRTDDLGPEYLIYLLDRDEHGRWLVETRHEYLWSGEHHAVSRVSIEEVRAEHSDASEVHLRMEEALTKFEKHDAAN